jgi:hypothetical protein
LKGLEHLNNDAQYLGISDHGVVEARNVEITLVELAKSAPGYRWLVSPVDSGDLVALNLGHTTHGQPASKWNRQVESQRADFTTLVGQIVHETRILAVLFRENGFELEDRCI